MANLFDYLTWRGDLTLAAVPWSLADSLVAASFCYNDVAPFAEGSGMRLHALAPLTDLHLRTGDVYFRQWRDLFYIMAETVRFGGMLVHDLVDVHSEASLSQFCAMTLDFDDGPTVVAFRGTDDSIVGWREDCNMSFETVPAQRLATEYLERIAGGACKPIVVTGHSKGGNLAAYAAAHVSPQAQDKLVSVCSFDGPGLDDATLASEGYARIRAILTCMIPQGSVVGLLLGYHHDYMIVRADAVGIFQHDAFTWQLIGPHFQVLQSNDVRSKLLDRTVHDWLAQLTPQARRTFVDALFSLVEPLHAATTHDLTEDKVRTAAAIVQASRQMDPETRAMFGHMISRLLVIGAESARDLVFLPLAESIPAALRQRLPRNLPALQGGNKHDKS